MVKIPELPGNYRTGDVVNGHVLTPRGHWVSLNDAASRGVQPRRYLDTQVSTIRDPNAPTQVASGRPQAPPVTAAPQAAWIPGTTTTQAPTPSPQAAARAAATRAAEGPRTPTPIRPATSPRTAAGPGPGHGAAPPPPAAGYNSPVAPPPASGYRSAPGGPTGAPVPGGPYAPPAPRVGQNLPRVRANPSTAGPTMRPGGTTSGGSGTGVPPPTIRQRKRGGGVIAFAVVAFIIFQVISAFLRNAPDFFSDGPDIEWETAGPTEAWADEIPEFDVVVESWEVWAGALSPGYLVDVTADERGGELLGVSLVIEAIDADGEVIATSTGWVQINGDEPVRTLGIFDDDVDVTDIDDLSIVTEAFSLGTSEAEVLVTDHGIADDGSGSPVATVTVESTGADAVTFARVWVVLRDGAGEIMAGSTTYVPELEPGDEIDVSITLWDVAELPEDYTLEAGAAVE